MTPFVSISPSSRRLWAGDADLKKQQQHGHGKGLWGILALAWASIGVIYGMTGQSQHQLYLQQRCFCCGWHVLHYSTCSADACSNCKEQHAEVACQRIHASKTDAVTPLVHIYLHAHMQARRLLP
jgi:hypothetical protein